MLYLALAEFRVAPRGSRGFHGKWPTVIAMGAPVLAICLIAIIAEGGREWLSALILLILGCLGILAGAAVAGLVTFRVMSPTSQRLFLLAGAAVVVAAAVVLIVGVIPLTESAGIFPDGTPGSSVPVFWGMAGLNIIVAAGLGFFGFRVGGKNRPSSEALAALAFLAFMSACLLVPVVFAFRGHGPVLLTASSLALLCLIAEIIATTLIGSTALRLSDTAVAKPE